MGFFSDIIGGVGKIFDVVGGHRQAKENQKDQYRFARESVRWRVADAKAAGVHPAVALGMNANSFSPVSVGSSGSFGDMGQSFGRAVDAVSSHDDRANLRKFEALKLENMALQNDMIRSQIANLTQRASNPAPQKPGSSYLIDGQGAVPSLGVQSSKFGPPEIVFSQQWPTSKQNVQLGPIWQANPYVSNAKDVEDRYGEGVSDWLWPLISLPSDVYWNARNHLRREPLGRGRFRPKGHFRLGN